MFVSPIRVHWREFAAKSSPYICEIYGKQSRPVTIRSSLQPRLLFHSLQSIRCHPAIGIAKDRVSRDVTQDSCLGVVAAGAAVHLEKTLGLLGIHLPLDNRAGQVPGDVGCSWKKVIIDMAAGIALPHLALAGKQPFVWLHPPVRDDSSLQAQLKWHIDF